MTLPVNTRSSSCSSSIEYLRFPFHPTRSSLRVSTSCSSPALQQEKRELYQRLECVFQKELGSGPQSLVSSQLDDFPRVFYDFEETEDEYDVTSGHGIRVRYAVTTKKCQGNEEYEKGSCIKRHALQYRSYQEQGMSYAILPVICTILSEVKKVSLSLNIKTNIPIPFEPMSDMERENLKNKLVFVLSEIRHFAPFERIKKTKRLNAWLVPMSCGVDLSPEMVLRSRRYFTKVSPPHVTSLYRYLHSSYPLTKYGWSQSAAERWAVFPCVGKSDGEDQRDFLQLRECCLKRGRDGHEIERPSVVFKSKYLERELFYGMRIFDELIEWMRSIFTVESPELPGGARYYTLHEGPFLRYAQAERRLDLLERLRTHQELFPFMLNVENEECLRMEVEAEILNIHQEKLQRVTQPSEEDPIESDKTVLELVASEVSSETVFWIKRHELSGEENLKKQISLLKQERDLALVQSHDFLFVLQRKYDEIQKSRVISRGMEQLYSSQLSESQTVLDGLKSQFKTRLSTCPMGAIEKAIRDLISRLPPVGPLWEPEQEPEYP